MSVVHGTIWALQAQKLRAMSLAAVQNSNTALAAPQQAIPIAAAPEADIFMKGGTQESSSESISSMSDLGNGTLALASEVVKVSSRSQPCTATE